MKSNDQYISLYDYKGTGSRQSGIGQKVYIAAKEKGIHVIYTDIPEERQTSEYNRVATYPKSFLDDYFGVTPTETDENADWAYALKEIITRFDALEAKFNALIQKLETNVTNSNEHDDDLPF